MTSSNLLFYHTNSPKPKNIKFTTKSNRQKQQILRLKKLEPKHYLAFLLQKFKRDLGWFIFCQPTHQLFDQFSVKWHPHTHTHIERHGSHSPPPSRRTVWVNPGTAAPILFILFSCLRVWIMHKTHDHINSSSLYLLKASYEYYLF